MIILKPIDRVQRRLDGREVDKIPNLNIIITFAAKYINIPYKKYISDFKYLVEGNIRCCNEFGIDMVSTISDPCREGYDMGAKIKFPEDDVPSFVDPLIDNFDELKNLSVVDPSNGKRMLDRIKAVKLYKEKVGQKYPILGWVEGPFALACDLRGMTNAMFDIHENSDKLHELLNICCEQGIKFAVDQVNAGADFIGIGDAAASLIGPDNYREFVLPYEKRLIKAVHSVNGKVKLHICGDINPLLSLLIETQSDIVDLDWMVDFKKAIEIFKGKTSANGNFDPVGILLQSTKDKVKNATKKCIKMSDNTTFISAGCEVPKDTPHENMYTMDETLKQYK